MVFIKVTNYADFNSTQDEKSIFFKPYLIKTCGWLIILATLLSSSSCAQNKNDAAAEDKSLRKLDHQKEGMLFKLQYGHSDCSYEILLNDMPVVTYFGLGEHAGLTIDINQYILIPGKQEITIRLYSPKKEENLFRKSLSKNSFVKIAVTKNKEPMSMLDQLNAKDKGNKYQWETLVYQTPNLAKEVSYSEYKTSFEVDAKDLTWKVLGWRKSKQLSNDPNIRKEVDAFYSNYKKILEDGDRDKFLSLIRNKVQEEAASQPWNKEMKSQLTKDMSDYAVEKRNFKYPCRNATLKFYGNGKVVTLVCEDVITFGYSPLISKTAKNLMPKSHIFYLHKPEGSDRLEIIR